MFGDRQRPLVIEIATGTTTPTVKRTGKVNGAGLLAAARELGLESVVARIYDPTFTSDVGARYFRRAKQGIYP